MDLKKVDLKDLIQEVDRRKKIIIPEIVKNINENIELLKSMGIEIEDNSDCDYILENLSINSNNVVVFNTEYR